MHWLSFDGVRCSDNVLPSLSLLRFPTQIGLQVTRCTLALLTSVMCGLLARGAVEIRNGRAMWTAACSTCGAPVHQFDLNAIMPSVLHLLPSCTVSAYPAAVRWRFCLSASLRIAWSLVGFLAYVSVGKHTLQGFATDSPCVECRSVSCCSR